MFLQIVRRDDLTNVISKCVDVPFRNKRSLHWQNK
jgi:hypothetical protein